jgi:hypothetical protein
VNKINEYSLNHFEKYEHETLMQYVKFKYCHDCKVPLYPYLKGNELKKFFDYEKELPYYVDIFSEAELKKRDLFYCEVCLEILCPSCSVKSQCNPPKILKCKVCKNNIRDHIPHTNRKNTSTWCPGKNELHAICKNCRKIVPSCHCGSISFCSVECIKSVKSVETTLKCNFCNILLCQNCDKQYISGLFICEGCNNS